MSPTSKHKGQPLPKLSMSMEQRRRRHTPADSLPADESAAEPLADGAAGGKHAAASAAEPAAAASASDQR